ncbi:vWA domain-containing protein [Paraliomyxa miuraensis]|uniref:vWA domain-containing protein n=1 Tax=Paraliomyxa miuraensis TaxID=376150 RepID=UPI002254C77C|nr:VWA domain-containing protein [Paraliomyxa miuraensis]MCX4240229.1 VWA domain-containing protein [Paraliomyxa miuraensis]
MPVRHAPRPLVLTLASALALSSLANCAKHADEAAAEKAAGAASPALASDRAAKDDAKREEGGERMAEGAMPPAPETKAEDDLPARIVAEASEAEPPHPEPDPVAQEKAARDRAQFFTHYGVNPTIDTRENPFSTFGVDVDTASYVMARSFLERGQLPHEDAIRVEEVVNYFDYHYAPPEEGDFSLHAEVVPSPQRTGYHVLHLGVKGKEIAAAQRPAANLVFVIDVSGSMGSQGRLQLVKDSLRLLIEQLQSRDSVGIVAYGSSARVILPPTPGSDHATISSAVDELHTEGSTNVEAGLRLGYELVGRQNLGAGINRVVLCSDGVANTGATTAEAILRQVAQEAARGITITTIGVGMGDYNDTLMEQLANKGNGNYAYVDDRAEARRVFVDHLTGTLQVIAKDVKLQLELDPRAVARYRLLGYENRGMSRSDFDDDRKDAGELGAGHTVTALYEIKLQPGEHPRLGTLRVRYKTPRSDTSTAIERDLPMSLVRGAWTDAAPPTQLSVVAAAYAEKLRGSYWVRNLGWSDVQRLYQQIDEGLRERPEVRELGRLIDRAAELDQRGDKFERDLPVAQMDFDRVPVLR